MKRTMVRWRIHNRKGRGRSIPKTNWNAALNANRRKAQDLRMDRNRDHAAVTSRKPASAPSWKPHWPRTKKTGWSSVHSSHPSAAATTALEIAQLVIPFTIVPPVDCHISLDPEVSMAGTKRTTGAAEWWTTFKVKRGWIGSVRGNVGENL